MVDDEPSRLRHPAELGLLITLGLLLALLVLSGVAAHDTARGANEDLARLVGHLPPVITHLLSFVAALGLLVLPMGYMADLLVHRQWRRLVEAVVGGVVALGVSEGIGASIASAKHSALNESVAIIVNAGGAITVLDGYLCAVAAFSVLSGIGRRPQWRAMYATAAVVYLIAVLAGGGATVLALAISYVLGAFVGVAVRYLLGSVNDRPPGSDIAAVLAERRQPLASLVRIPNPHDRHRIYQAITRSGTQLQVTVLDRAMITSGALYRIYRMVRVRREVARAPDISLERAAERRSLLAILTRQAGAPVPRMIEGVPCGPDAIVLAFESTPTTTASPARPPDEAALLTLWRQIARMHEQRVTHHGLTPSAILVAADGTLTLTSLVDGAAFASNLRISLDRAELLVTSALLVGAPTAVRVAREAIGQDRLAAIGPVLQPVAFNRETRLALRRQRALLAALRGQIHSQLDAPVSPPTPELERVRPRTVLMLVALIIAGYLLLGQLGSVDLATVFGELKWRWAPLVLAFSALSYIAAALGLTGTVRERLKFGRTVLVQIAGSFAGFITPPAVGAAALNVRYLHKAGLPTAGAATSVAVNQVVNVAGHVVLLLIVAAATGSSAEHRLLVPGWAFVALGTLGGAALLMLAVPVARRWLLAKIMPAAHEAWPRLLGIATQPTKLAQALGACSCSTRRMRARCGWPCTRSAGPFRLARSRSCIWWVSRSAQPRPHLAG